MKRIILTLIALVVLVAVAGGVWITTLLDRPYTGYTDAEVFVEISPGSGSTAMGHRLEQAGVVRNAMAFRAAVWLSGAGRRLHAGEYRFDRPMTPREVVDKLARGDVYLQPITFREGLTIKQMAALYSEKGMGAAEQFTTRPATHRAFTNWIRKRAI